MTTSPAEHALPEHSRHLFLFPLRWTIHTSSRKKRAKPVHEDILNDFENLLTKQGDHSWERNWYNFTDNPDPAFAYNEYTYFYDFMRSALYDTTGDKSEPVNYYEYIIGPNARFKIKAFYRKEAYDLALKGISLHVFNTGVAVLTYSLLNSQYDSADDILLINQLGRRLYPEFLGTDDLPLTAPLKASYIAEYIVLDLDTPAGAPRTIRETYCSFQHPERLWPDTTSFSVPMPAYVTDLFPDTIYSFSKALTSTHHVSQTDGPQVRFQQIMDDRMFVLCWYGSTEWSRKLKVYHAKKQSFQYEDDKFWYAYLFCDSGRQWPSCTHPRMIKAHIRETTYERWAAYGTLFGVTRDTFMALTPGKPKLMVPIDQHVHRIYYQLVILCLVQRASLLQFKMQVGDLSKQVRQAKKGQMDERLVDDVGQLYMRYLDFINRLFYREITSQIQGDDLYFKLQTQMRLRDEVEVLDREISELHDHIETLQTRDISRAVTILVPLTLVSLFFGFIGIDKFAYPFGVWEPSPQFIFYTGLLVLFTVLSILFATVILTIISKQGRKGNTFIRWVSRWINAIKTKLHLNKVNP